LLQTDSTSPLSFYRQNALIDFLHCNGQYYITADVLWLFVFVDAFEFYMFHFAYFLVNTKAFQSVNASRRVCVLDLYGIVYILMM